MDSYTILVSVTVQQFFMRAPFAQYAVEFFLLTGCGLYHIIAHYRKGIDIWNTRGEGKTKILISTLISGVLSTIFCAVFAGNHQTDGLLYFFVFFVVFFFITRMLMIALNNRRQKSIEKELYHDDAE